MSRGKNLWYEIRTLNFLFISRFVFDSFPPSSSQNMVNAKIAVVGGGLIGLSTAVFISESISNCSVTVIADRFTPNTTSDVAAGMLIPHVYPGEWNIHATVQSAKILHSDFPNFQASPKLKENNSVFFTPNLYSKPQNWIAFVLCW